MNKNGKNIRCRFLALKKMFNIITAPCNQERQDENISALPFLPVRRWSLNAVRP